MLLDGLYVPLTAPFYRDGALYLRKAEHNVGRYSLTPASGLIALGPGGEGRTLTDAETREFLRCVTEATAPEKVLIAGLNGESVVTALAVAETAAEFAFDAVLLGAPATWSAFTAQDGVNKELLTWFRTLADRSPLPLVLSSDARRPSLALPVELIAELAQHPNVLGLLDADLTVERLAAIAAATLGVEHDVTATTVFAAVTARMLRAQKSSGAATFVAAEALSSGGAAVATAPPQPALRTRTKKVGFQVLGAGNAAMLPALQAGARGFAPALASCAPQACHEVYAAFKDGDPALAAEKEERLRKASRVMSEEFGVAGIKYACDLNGYYGGAPRLPGLPLDAAQKQSVESVMRELRN